jgi:hypothetical protein
MNEEKFKTCRYCAEQVKAAAKVCPRCRQWLSIFSLRNPGVLIATVALCGLCLIIGFFIKTQELINPGVDFFPYRNQIPIVESHLEFGTNYNRPSVYVVAVITNQTDVAWSGVEFDARFFNKAGALIDVGRGGYYWTLYPKMNAAIKIDANTLHPLMDYDSYKLYIGSAHDARLRF